MLVSTHLKAIGGLVQQASDTKDGGSKIMESLSSMDEGDQVAELFLHTDLETLWCTSKCVTVHKAATYTSTVEA